jgi:acetyl esterase/lipase
LSADKSLLVTRRTLLTSLATLFLAGCSRLLFYGANLPALFGSYRRIANVAYGPDKHQRLDVYVPHSGGDARPLVVFWHGGRWETGDKADYRFVGAALASLGYVAMLPNYRHYPEVKLAGFMDDTARAAAFAAAHALDYGATPEKLYLMGHSSGAHMAALVTLNPAYLEALGTAPEIAGFIGLSGPYDFLPLLESDVQDMFGPPENYPLSQPINFVRDGEPPMLLIHGLSDEVVLPKNSRNLAAALEARGNRVTLLLYPKAGHADTVAALSAPARGRASTLKDIAAFIGGARSS